MNGIMYPILVVCSDGITRTNADLEAEMSGWLGLSAEQRQERTKYGYYRIIESKTRWAADYLYKAGLLDKTKRAGLLYYTIAQKGETVVADPDVSKLTTTYLRKNFPPYR